MQKICKSFNIVHYLVDIQYDGEEAISKAKKSNFRLSTSITHFDLVSILHTLIQECTGNFIFLYIKRYQDKEK